MKQLFQNLRTGRIFLEDMPSPAPSRGRILIETSRSLISPGTERMLLDFGRAGYLRKARQQPEKLIQLYNKAKSDGFKAAIQTALARLDEPLPLGYCNVGRVLHSGSEKAVFMTGDRVVSNGHHSEIVSVPPLLCARIPDGVSDEAASFSVLGSVALQGVRLARPEIGETFAVLGLGVIGLLAVQILKAHGVRVLGVDIKEDRVSLSEKFGARGFSAAARSSAVKAAEVFSEGRGVDGVLVCTATRNDEVMRQAAQMCRKRGRIVLTGTAGLRLRRNDFYTRELSFQVSCSYGPGRHDPAYEERGEDYPVGYARWTVQRNFETVLDLIREGRIDTEPLITHRIPFAEIPNMYERMLSHDELGIVLVYERDSQEKQTAVIEHRLPRASSTPVCGVIGPGKFACLHILPALRKEKVRLRTAVSESGRSAGASAGKFGFEKSSSSAAEIFSDPEITTVFITTRHDTHAGFTVDALRAGKNVYVEKPLCLNETELDSIVEACNENLSTLLMVGFNRRFAPLTSFLLSGLQGRTSPLSITYTCNAGFIPPDHWIHDPSVGGGRIIGEMCHFVDLLMHISGCPVKKVFAAGHQRGIHSDLRDSISATLQFGDGSIGNINYFSDGHKGYPKEILTVFSEGRVFSIDNFRRFRASGAGRLSSRNLWRQDKGHEACVKAFLDSVRTGARCPVSLESAVAAMKTTFAIERSLSEGAVCDVQS